MLKQYWHPKNGLAVLRGDPFTGSITGDILPDMGLRVSQFKKTAAIVNSRQNKYPLGSDKWVLRTVAAANYIKKNDLTLLTSLGMNTWELSLALAADLKIPVNIIIPRTKNPESYQENARQRFNLDKTLTKFTYLPDEGDRKKRSWWHLRDSLILEMADQVLPVSIRPGGFMFTELGNITEKIDDGFQIKYNTIRRPRPRYDHLEINSETFSDKYLYHFTRSCAHSWPGETDFEFYKRLANSTDDYCNSAPNALRRILGNYMIYASSNNIRGGHRVVSFTALSGPEITKLFQYRSRLINPYFEPYGIAIQKSAAIKAGFKPVIYGKPTEYDSLSDDQKPFFQNVGKTKGGWQAEKEWRHLGDLNMGRFTSDDIKVIIYSANDVELFKSFLPLEIIVSDSASIKNA